MMRLGTRCRMLGLMVAPLVAAGAAGSAQGITVVVDGQRLTTSAPPREVGGRIMVGMRDIFERLGAEVGWDAAERKITASRGTRTVVLWIGRNVAYVDDASIGLDVPPMLIGGYTYVPVRFPSEALGANVSWLSAARTVLVDTSTMPPIGPGPGPGPGPITPPITGVQGEFIQLIAATPRVILIKSYETGTGQTYVLAPNAVFQRGDTSVAVPPVVNPEDLMPGDDVKLALNAAGQVERIEARHQPASVTYQAAAANSLLADNGQVYHLAADVRITREGVGPITLADLGVGENLAVRQNPVTGEVWEITAPAGTPPPPPAGVQIFMIAPENYTRPLLQNGVLSVKLDGTPGGQATFDLGAAVAGLAMTENPAGVYRGVYKVKRNDEIVGVPLIGHLTVGGQEAPVAQSDDAVSLDAVKPTIDGYVPPRDAVLNTNRPVIQVAYSDGNGVGIDPQSVTFAIGGDDLTSQAFITEDALTYYAPEMPDGIYKAHVKGADLAGNAFNELHWQFAIDTKTAPSAITAVSHAPAGVELNNGDTLTVTLFATPRGRSASFDIVGLKDNLTMIRQGGPDSREWRGQYTARAGEMVADGVVRGRFVDQNGNTHQLDDPLAVSVNARVRAQLAITDPANGAAVGATFDLGGAAGPRRTVTYEATYEGRSRVFGARVTGKVQDGQVKADANGQWRVSINTTAARGNVLLQRIDQFIIKCAMLDRNGNPVQQTQITARP
jgi:hypothetical protein